MARALGLEGRAGCSEFELRRSWPQQPQPTPSRPPRLSAAAAAPAAARPQPAVPPLRLSHAAPDSATQRRKARPPLWGRDEPPRHWPAATRDSAQRASAARPQPQSARPAQQQQQQQPPQPPSQRTPRSTRCKVGYRGHAAAWGSARIELVSPQQRRQRGERSVRGAYASDPASATALSRWKRRDERQEILARRGGGVERKRAEAVAKEAEDAGDGEVDGEDAKSAGEEKGDGGERRPPFRMLLDSVSQLHGFLGQKNVRKLLRETNYNRRELYVIFARFKALCAMSPTPAGINKETFKKGVARLAVEDDLFVDRVFNLVDQDGSGQIEWAEFLSAMSALEKGNPDVKNRFCFQAYDLDEDGFIGREDLAAMFSSSSMLKADQTTRDVVDAFVERVFKLVGVEAKGKIGLEDLHNYMRSRPEGEDVWDIFGRSMLKDFGTRPAQ